MYFRLEAFDTVYSNTVQRTIKHYFLLSKSVRALPSLIWSSDFDESCPLHNIHCIGGVYHYTCI